MMVLKRFKPEVKVTRWLELASWSRIWLLPLGPTDEYGLGYLLASKGLNVEVFSEYPSFRLRPKSRSMQTFTSTLGRWMLSSFNFNRRRALAAGVKESFLEVNCELLIEVLGKGCFPIVMVDQSGYAPDDSFPDGVLHWVVVTKYADDFYVHDPDLGVLRLPPSDLGRGMDLERNFGAKKRIVVACVGDRDQQFGSKAFRFARESD